MWKVPLLILVSLTGALYDWKIRRIPNWLTFGTLFLMIFINIFHLKINCILDSFIGFLVGVLLLLIPYLIRAMGAGDVKLLGAVGAIVGVRDVVWIFFFTAVCGLILSLIWMARKPGHLKFVITTGQALPTVNKEQKFPYGIAISLGTMVYIILQSQNFNFHLPLPQLPWQ